METTTGKTVDRVTVSGDGALLLRVEEAAERLGIHRTLMYRLVGTGEVESVRVGRLRRIPVSCLEEYVAGLREAAAGHGPTAA